MNLLIYKLRNLIASGNSPDFVAFNAHCFGAAFILTAISSLTNVSVHLLLALLILYAAIKEFWFDATYEIPKQTLNDNVQDFVGYAVGGVLAIGLHYLLITKGI